MGAELVALYVIQYFVVTSITYITCMKWRLHPQTPIRYTSLLSLCFVCKFLISYFQILTSLTKCSEVSHKHYFITDFSHPVRNDITHNTLNLFNPLFGTKKLRKKCRAMVRSENLGLGKTHTPKLVALLLKQLVSAPTAPFSLASKFFLLSPNARGFGIFLGYITDF